MSKTMVGASFCVLSVVVAGCSGPATAEPSGKPSPVRADSWHGHVTTANDEQVEGPDVATTGVVEADDVRYSTGATSSDAEAALAGGSILAFVGKKIASAGGCTLYAYETSGHAISAGDITVASTTQSIALDPTGKAPNVSYSESSTPTFPFATGTMSFTAAGGPGVGAFTGSVKAPKAIAGFTPPTAVTRAKPVDFTWTAESGSIAAYIFANSTADGGSGLPEILRCPTTDTGSYTMTTAAIALIPKTYTEASVALVRYAQTKVPVGGFTATLVVNKVFETAAPIPIR